MKPAIRVDGLSKRYRLGQATGSYRTLREAVMDRVTGSWRRLRRPVRSPDSGASDDQLWALKDVCFEVQPGEVLGVIGHNGAGKSTLLKILSRITKPTDGEVELRGRVGSLLEVGTGFHPELTGRENVYLNGAVLGMTRREVARKFDEIVDFAEVERFLDTPVKRYSSGMYTRLAFAVAAHLEPEILVVDEVLAVGDAAFQRKCLGKMGQVSRRGRTVLFVSHNMTAVKALCGRAILLERGQVTMDGDPDGIVDRYLTSGTEMSRTGLIPEDAPRMHDAPDEARFRSVRLTDLDGNDLPQLYFRQPFRVTFLCDVLKDLTDAHFEVSISTTDGTQITYSTTTDGGLPPVHLKRGHHQVSATFDTVLLPHNYTVDLGVHHSDGRTSDFVQRTLDFTVLRVAESGDDHYHWHRTRGYVRAPVLWDLGGPAKAGDRSTASLLGSR
jgi:lipopolysaccharide transport system ATP-binding protein